MHSQTKAGPAYPTQTCQKSHSPRLFVTCLACFLYDFCTTECYTGLHMQLSLRGERTGHSLSDTHLRTRVNTRA
jgi:hypothetical protein